MASIASQWLSPDLQGCQVRLQMSQGSTIEGVVVDVSHKSSKVTLDQVTFVDTAVQHPHFEQLHFYAQDISSCMVLGGLGCRKYVLHRDEDEDRPHLLRVPPVPAHLEKRNSAHNNSELICHRQETDPSEVIKKGIIKLIGTPNDLPNLRRPIATDFEVIDEVNDQLSEAIAAIRKERTISVAYEGVKVGRHGHLSVLAVVASSKVYVFDVQKMKKDLFDHGLKEIFESDGIEKIIHGCRKLSDCLHHHYQVGLNNVFDTMVADVIIYMNKKLESGDLRFPPYVRDVQTCLRTFLNLTGDQLKYTRSRQGRKEDQACNWGQRPLSLRQIDALVKDVVYLGELAHLCLEQMLQKFRAGVEFFLGLDRDCSEEELRCLPPDDVLPMGFRDALKLSAMRAAPNRTCRSYDEDCYREHGHLARRGTFSKDPQQVNYVPSIFSHHKGGTEASRRNHESIDNNKRNYHHYRDSLRHGRGFSSMNNDCVHSRQPRDSYRQEEFNQKQNDHCNVKKGKRTEDSLLYMAMQPQTNEMSTELSDPATDIARKSNVGEFEKLNASSEPTESTQEEPATSVLQDHCPVANGNKKDSKAGREATDEPHPDTSFCSFERDVRFPAPQCSSMGNGVDAFRQMLSQHCNDNGPPCNIPSGNHDSGHQVEALTAKHTSDNTELALPETLVEHCYGSGHRFDTMQHKSLVQVSSQSSSSPHVERQQGVLTESKPVPGWNHNYSPNTEPAVDKKRAPRSQNSWANRPVNENKKGISFRPVDMKVAKSPG